jgi:hypothetical protein
VRSFLLHWSAPALVVCLVGCGLGDYEERMLQAQQRLLGEPLQVPQPPDVFLRPPRGIASIANAFPTHRDVAIYRFQQAEGKAAVTAVFIAQGGEPSAFQSNVLDYFKQDPVKTERKQHDIRRSGGTPLLLESAEWDEGDTVFRCHFVRNSATPVALVFQIEKSRLAEAEPALEQSLQSLAIGAEAGESRRSYERQRSGK